MKLATYTSFFLAFLFYSHWLVGQNPIIKDIGMSDPHVRVFNDTLYLFCGHDSDPSDTTWVMKEWRIFSTVDLINWKLEQTISPLDNYMEDGSTDCWAGDAATRNGKYYFYFSDRKRGIGVMVAESPTGTYQDALGKPLVAPMHDPTILIDDDKNQTPYIIYGDKEGGGFHIARLNEDMISLAEQPIPIQINGEEWEKAPTWMDKNYIFKHNGTYYLSWGRDYAVSNNIYGPYECLGAVGQGHHLDEFAHGSFSWWKGQFYHIWCYYLKRGYKYRESIITYCHFDEEGKIVTDTVFLDQHFSHGVGQYNAAWSKIEAEWYYEVPPGIQKVGNGNNGFALSNFKDGSWVRFANVDFDKAYGKFEARVLFHGKTGEIEIWADGINGTQLGKVSLAQSADATLYQLVSCKLGAVKGRKDIFLKFRGDDDSVLKLDWFRFRDE